jgi:hypothetical protein
MEFLMNSFFVNFSILNISSHFKYVIHFRPWFLMSKWLLIKMKTPCMQQIASLLLLSRFSLSFDNFIIICFSVNLFEFILFSFLDMYVHVFHQI